MTKVTVNERTFAHDCERVAEHPAFLSAQIGNVQIGGGGTYAFDSELSHRQMVRLSFSNAKLVVNDNLHYSRISPSVDKIFEVWFTPAQWASLLCSFGNGEGVACTLKKIDGTRKDNNDLEIDEPFVMNAQDFVIHLERKNDEAFERYSKALDELEEAVSAKSMSKTVIREKIRDLRVLEGRLKRGAKFTEDQFKEFMSKKVAVAKSEIEAFHQNSLRSIAFQVLKEEHSDQITTFLKQLENKGG